MCVVGIADELRGQRPVAFVLLKEGAAIEEKKLEEELISFVRDKIGAVAYFKNAAIVKRLPKTRSGKILRKTICHIADGIDVQYYRQLMIHLFLQKYLKN